MKPPLAASLLWFAAVTLVAQELPESVSPQITTNGVTFTFYDPNAFLVSVTGDFNQWNINSHLMESDKKGLWTLTIPLKPGRYQYQFNVNGIYWKPDPRNPNRVTDHYGGVKSVVEVPATAPPLEPPSAPAVAAGPKPTRFTYQNLTARQVAVGGYFNRWNPAANPMSRDDAGVWTATVPLKPGQHPYKFWVDGKWVPDPANPARVPDGFGGFSSVISVLP